jgi:ecdysteroid 25-hydroxylase
MGMIKFGPKREFMENRIMEGINKCIAKLHMITMQKINPMNIIMDTVGNIANDFVFGIKYDWDSNEWNRIKHLQEEGVKLVGVNAGANFLPILR